MDYLFETKNLSEVACDMLVEGVWQGENLSLGSYLQSNLRQAVINELERRKYKGKEGELVVLPLLGHPSIKHLLIAGLGEKRGRRSDRVRTLAAKIIKSAHAAQISNIVIHPGLITAMKDKDRDIQAFVEGVELASYQFSSFRKHTAEEESKKKTVNSIIFLIAGKKLKNILQKGIERGLLFSSATILARDMVNTPSMRMHPEEMANIAKSLADRNSSITCKIRGLKEMQDLGMLASLAVGQGSVHEPKFVHLFYKPKKANKNTKRIALVGKAVTFDSGGLNLKPESGMIDMKIDMAGAAAVLGVFKALPDLCPNIEVHGLFIAVENMPSGSAYRPGDVVSAMDGTTIEVENTDAEGRITLADALAYAALEIKPDAIIDLATLTGAVIVALGSDISGLLGNNDKLKQEILSASKLAGEPIWELPMYHAYSELIKSKIADVKNVGGRPGGVITAALFLEKFIHDVPWAHLDIAGPSYVEKETRAECPIGGTGWGVRTLLEYLWNNQ